MAKFDIVGLEDLERQLLRRVENVEEAATSALEAGAQVLVDAQRAELKAQAMTDRSAGTLEKSIDKTSVKTDGNRKVIEVYPLGDQPHGTPAKGKKGKVSNAQVGFIREYGRSNMPAHPYMRPAKEKSRKAVPEAMRRAWEEKQNGG